MRSVPALRLLPGLVLSPLTHFENPTGAKSRAASGASGGSALSPQTQGIAEQLFGYYPQGCERRARQNR
jgi:hypothetical protein